MGINSNDLTLRVGFDVDKFGKDLQKATKQIDTFSSNMTKLGGVLGGVFSVRIAADFVAQISRLAGEAEGVTAAFNKLDNANKLMRDLKAATGGTVSELELMKRSVMASNFDISLQALPKLLEFATLRARQTGQSVNYLVDSIVTGIGRKSKLILDNLGISAVQLTEALGGASAASSTIGEVADAVGRIAEKNLKTMGQLTNDAAVKADRLNASWENLKVTLGKVVNAAGGSALLEEANRTLDMVGKVISSPSFGGQMIHEVKDLEAAIKKLNDSNGGNGLFKPEAKEHLDWIREAAKRLGVEIKIITEETTQATKVFSIKPKGIWVNGEETKAQIRNVAFLEDQIKLLGEEIKLSGSSSQITKFQTDIKALEDELDKLLGRYKEMDKYQARFDAWSNRLTQKRTMDIGDFTHFQTGESKKEVSPADKSMADAADAIAKRTKAAMAKIKENNENIRAEAEKTMAAYARVGDIVGQSFANMISGSQTFAQAMTQMASQVVAQIERIVLARMIEKSFEQGGPTPVAIALAAIGFGAVKALFSKIGGGNSGAGRVSSSYGGFTPAGNGSMNIMGEFRIHGDSLVAVLDNQNRRNGRSKVSYSS